MSLLSNKVKRTEKEIASLQQMLENTRLALYQLPRNVQRLPLVVSLLSMLALEDQQHEGAPEVHTQSPDHHSGNQNVHRQYDNKMDEGDDQ